MYTLNAEEAKKADQKGGYINETGKYKGKFTRVEKLTASTGTQGVGFTFVSDEGQTANFSVYTIKSDGTPLSGNQFMMALMACMTLRASGEPVMKSVKRYDYDTKQNYDEDAPLFTAMMDKPIGLLLQSCEYEKEKNRIKTGEYGWKLEPFAPFQASTELMATEILNKSAKPEMLAKLFAGLKDRPLRSRAHIAKSETSSHDSGPAFDDTIPF